MLQNKNKNQPSILQLSIHDKDSVFKYVEQS